METITYMDLAGVFMSLSDAQATLNAILRRETLHGEELEIVLKAKPYLDSSVELLKVLCREAEL